MLIKADIDCPLFHFERLKMNIINKLTATDVDFAFRKTVDISPEFLKKHRIQGLILDVDNTLTTDENLTPAKGIPEWVNKMKNAGIRMVILSNNRAERVKPLAEKLNLRFVSKGAKPLRKGYEKALKIMGLHNSRVAGVGDQLFTDIWGAKASKIRAVYVSPIAIEGRDKKFILFKRKLETPFLPKKFEDE